MVDIDTREHITDAPPDGQEPTPDATGGARPGIDIQAMLGQLQAMIGKVAAASEPRLREVAAKAAELAVVAGERAGPIAHTLADKTDEVGHTLAERAAAYASSIRSRSGATDDAGPPDAPAAVEVAAEDSPSDGA